MGANSDLTKEQMEQLAVVFRSEALEHIKALAEVLFTLEEGGGDPTALLGRAFREAHSLKGSAATLGFERAAAITHRFEDALGVMQKDHGRIENPVLDVLLETLETVRASVAGSSPGDAVLSPREERALERIEAFFPRRKASVPPLEPTGRGASAAAPARAEGVPAAADEQKGQARPGPEFVRVAQDRLDAVFARFGELFETSIQIESLGHDMRLNAHEAMQMAERLTSLQLRLEGSPHEGEVMEVLDHARNLLVMLRASAKRFEQEERALSKLIHRTQESVGEIRMAPVSAIFVSIRGQIREAEKLTGKRVDLELDGGEYAVDRSVLDAVEDPIGHILRNAIDHGIEAPAERRAAGKPETGRITVSARHTGDAVELSISDDGRGIDAGRIRAALVERGRVGAEQARDLSEDQLYDYLFEAGFSTREGVSKVSGRGVGLDVVKFTVERLGGEVRLSSGAGTGTVITMRLPLAMSTLRCLLVRTAGRVLAIPAANIEKVLVLDRKEIGVIGGGQVIVYRDLNIPISALSRILELSRDGDADPLATSQFAAIVRFGDRRFAFGVEELLEYSQLVLKPLGDLLERVPNVSGLSLFGTGELALVLNPADLIRSAGGLTAEQANASLSEGRDRPSTVTILAVDDSIATRTLLKTLLESAGYRVLTAVDGLQALNVLAGNRVDLVISDVQMPNMNGFELTSAIKSRPNLSRLPVVLVTSLGSDEDMAAGLAAGADAHIVKKQLTRGELMKTINQLL
ncbi:MAG: hybrid sensor histidine kinase/response regulator [Proteobacteria bacterium]|jgi:two-component system chemotaxis sensor kinase CheA|nr:hybrid sensor histidine kinase/response regulator [Pseudomonadota bacterium]